MHSVKIEEFTPEILRESNSLIELHSVEKCTKLLSRLKIFREITQQKFAKSAFANAWFSTL